PCTRAARPSDGALSVLAIRVRRRAPLRRRSLSGLAPPRVRCTSIAASTIILLISFSLIRNPLCALATLRLCVEIWNLKRRPTERHAFCRPRFAAPAHIMFVATSPHIVAHFAVRNDVKSNIEGSMCEKSPAIKERLDVYHLRARSSAER